MRLSLILARHTRQCSNPISAFRLHLPQSPSRLCRALNRLVASDSGIPLHSTATGFYPKAFFLLSSFSFFKRLNLSKLYYAYFKFLNASITQPIARTRPQGIKKETKKPPPDKTHSPTVISLGPPNCTINERKNAAHTATPTTPKKRAESLKPPFIPFPFLRGFSLDTYLLRQFSTPA